MRSNTEQGFAGSVSALSVADVLQLQKSNGFSGSIVFSHEGHEAIVFVQHGEVVHAEAGDAKGEEAICAILAWTTGNFETHANVSTFAKTIDKRLDHLLLDALRRIDEARRDGASAPPPAAPRPPQTQKRPAAGIAERARSVPGVTHAAVIRDGAAVNDRSEEAASLAARGVFLASLVAAPLGELLGLGDLQRAAISAQGEQLLLFRSTGGGTYLAVSISGGTSLTETEAALRRVLSTKPVG
jgi:hypothetical protein